MRHILAIAADEWRFWIRSRLALAGLLVMAVLLVMTSFVTAARVSHERDVRLEHQQAAEERFLAQPDRHPHRMVHYGHYVHRIPGPLAILDPGVDRVTGQSIFLEGHRQNSAMFAEARGGASLGRLADLTPALVYQLFAPLLLIVLGHSLIVRERESATLAPLLAQGLSPGVLIAGKAAALGSVMLLMLLPICGLSAFAAAQGEALLSGLVVTGTYALYLGLWGAAALLVSALANQRGMALGILFAVWLLAAIIMPRAAVNIAGMVEPVPGKIETDLALAIDMRDVGDGHDAGASAYDRLRANLLSEHNAERIEDLPVNFRGMVALYSEERLTRLLNEYAEAQMAREQAQAQVIGSFGWASPLIAASSASRILSGTDLGTHHRFLREAETIRYEFVQGLNRAHAHDLSYTDDINRNRDVEAFDRARISAGNWQVLDRFRFHPAPAGERLLQAAPFLVMLAFWLAALLAALAYAGGRLRP